jgi:hypothetical protein
MQQHYAVQVLPASCSFSLMSKAFDSVCVCVCYYCGPAPTAALHACFACLWLVLLLPLIHYAMPNICYAKHMLCKTQAQTSSLCALQCSEHMASHD